MRNDPRYIDSPDGVPHPMEWWEKYYGDFYDTVNPLFCWMDKAGYVQFYTTFLVRCDEKR